MFRINRFLRRLARRTEGAAAVEFALVLSLLLTFLMGMIDFGHAWFLKQVVTNASREGARCGVIYPHTDVNEIQQNVYDGVRKILDWTKDTNAQQPTIALGSGATGTPLVVTVTYTKSWWIINHFMPGMADTVQIESRTVMRYE